MNSTPNRTPDVNASTPRNGVPRAPPLPAPRPLQGVIRNAAYKFMGLPSSRSTSPQASRAELRAALGSLHRHAVLGTQDATASHKTGLNINTLAINERGTHALIGGKEIFKTVKVENGVCVEDRNLRTTIRSTPTQASGEVRKVYSIDIADVAWAKSDFGDYVAAATTSGKIILYDLGHATLRATLLHEHARQVHRVTFNPFGGNLLLSGSQDGTVRLWDIREARANTSTLQSKRKFAGAGDGVRDVKWSPTDGLDFAYSTDSGWIQRWDMRYHRVPKIRIPAHQSICTSLDWHPDGKHLVSAGMDKMLRIWDFTTARKHKPVWEVKTPFPISNARWRPSCESSMPDDNGARMCTQIATAYDQDHPIVHIWDLRRPALPFRELRPYAKSPTDLLWHSQDLLWTVGRDGIFLQSDIHHTNKVIERRNLQAIATAASGKTSFAVQERHQPRRPVRLTPMTKLPPPKTPSMSQSPEYSLLSRSWADESLDHSFLTVQPRRSSHSKSSTRYSSATATPPSGLPAKTIINLDDILLHRQSFAPPQSIYQGLNPLHVELAYFKVIAMAYNHALRSSSQDSLQKHVQAVFVELMHATRLQGQHQLAQTWDIVAFSTGRHLEKRLQAYLAAGPSDKDIAELPSDVHKAVQALLQKTKSSGTSPAASPASMRPVTSIAQALANTESYSNVTTPLARPSTNGRHAGAPSLNVALPDLEVDQDLGPLPPSLTAHVPPMHVKVDPRPTESQLTRENLQAIQSQRSTPMPIENGNHHSWAKPMLNMDPGSPKAVRPSLLKHVSDESFSFLVGSASSRDASIPTSYNGSDGQPASLVKEHPTRPLLRVNSQSPRLNGNGSESYKFESPDHEESHQRYDGEDSAVQTLQQSLTLGNTSAAHAEIIELQASAQLDVETEEAFSLAEMLQELVNHYGDKGSSAQTAAQMILMLVPLLPHREQIGQDTVEAIMVAYLDSLAGSTEISSVLETAFQHIISAGMNPLQIESILSTYHEQLLAQQMYTEAASLRRLTYPLFPGVYDYGVGSDNLTLTCGTCRKRAIMNHGELRCSSCTSKQSSCAVCLSSGSPFSQSMGGNLLTSCLLCNHSTHSDCAREWFGALRGHGCPTEGCLCVCVT